ncbi:MAG: C-type lectin domain-containing protein [Candidatus Hydrogenedentota bacterium]
MRKNYLVSGLVIALAAFSLSVTGAYAQTVPLSHPVDWQQEMQDAADVDESSGFLEPGDTDFIGPDVADLNNNGTLDVVEFELLEALADPGSAFHDPAVTQALDDNVAQCKADFGTLITGVDDGFALVGGAMATLGAPGDFEALIEVAEFAGDFVANIPELTNYTQVPTAGACGDPDGDGVKTINEFNASDAACSDCVDRALDPNINDDGGDPYEVCTGGYSFFREGFAYEPNSGRIYQFVEEDVTWPDAQAAAQATTVAGEPLPGNLATVDSEAIKDFFVAQGFDGWVGGTDQAVEGEWIWIATGEQFWQGAADGSAVGGAYTNWNGGEPNNANEEDFIEINSQGGWNDNGTDKTNPYIVEFEGTYPDNNGDGIPDAFEDNNDDGVPDGLGVPSLTVEIDVISGQVTDMVPGVSTASLQANVTGAIEVSSYSWSVGDTAIASVSPADAESTTLSALATGSTTLTLEVEGTVDTDTGTEQSSGSTTLSVTVKKTTWVDLCSLDDTFAQQGAQLASAAAGAGLGLPGDFSQWDVELGVGDGVPDAWQLHLLAYVLCQEGIGALKTEGTALPAQQYLSNLDNWNSFLAQASALAEWLGTVQANETDLLTLAELVATESGGACDSDLGGFTVSEFLVLLATGGSGDPGDSDLDEVLSDFATVGAFAAFVDTLAGLSGLSTEMQATVVALIPRDDLEQLLQLTDNTLPVLQGLDACPSTDAQNLADSLANALGAAPAVEFGLLDSLEVFQLGDVKLPNEPFAGDGDFDGDGVMNAEVAAGVGSNGGDQDDFVAGATGEFGPFWPGNPNLPVGAPFGLAVLITTLGAAGVLRMRRKR